MDVRYRFWWIGALGLPGYPELLYSGLKNVDLHLRLYPLHGERLSDFGENQNSRKIEFYVKYYF